jgi:hypothetical protein
MDSVIIMADIGLRPDVTNSTPLHRTNVRSRNFGEKEEPMCSYRSWMRESGYIAEKPTIAETKLKLRKLRRSGEMKILKSPKGKNKISSLCQIALDSRQHNIDSRFQCRSMRNLSVLDLQ